MGPPTTWQRLRQVVGRAIRETGQACDRVALQTASLAVTPHAYYDDPVLYQDCNTSRHRQCMPLLHAGRPVVHAAAAYIAPCATLLGSVRIGPGSSVWYGAVLRGDSCENAESFDKTDEELLAYAMSEHDYDHDDHDHDDHDEWELEPDRFTSRRDRHGGGVFVGRHTNIQDGCILTARTQHCQIGNGVTVGHLAQIHSATIQDYCLIGMGAVIGEGACVEREALVAAGAVVAAGARIQSGELWVGNPARKMRNLTAEQRQRLHYQSSEYVGVATEQRGVMQLGGNLAESMLQQQQPEQQEAEAQEPLPDQKHIDREEALQQPSSAANARLSDYSSSSSSSSSAPPVVVEEEAASGGEKSHAR